MAMRMLGLATAMPPYTATQSAYADYAERLNAHAPGRQRAISRLFRRAGVDRRGSVLMIEPNGAGALADFYEAKNDPSDRGPTTAERMRRYEREALPLAAEASSCAIRNAACDPGRITHLVTASCTGFAAPGTDVQLISALGLRADVQRTHIGFMGCHGAFNALRAARGLAAADPSAVILVCAYELCSLHYYYGHHAEQLVANALFADGAAAAVCRDDADGAAPGVEQEWRLCHQASVILPETESAMTWRITDHGFVMTLSPQVPQMIRRHLREWLEQWLDSLGLTVEQVPSWAIHPGGPRILDAIGESIGLGEGQLADSRAVLAEHGNMSSPTILFILDRLRCADAQRPCVGLGFGPGLTIEAMLFE